MALTQVQGGMILPSTTLTTPIVATTMGVGGATPASSGSGITFPATQSASTDANTLDDYEEGTWTPSVGGNATYNVQWGKYVKVGTTVTVIGAITINTLGTGNTNKISGLPFTPITVPSNGFGGGSVGYWAGSSTSLTTIYLVGAGGDPNIYFGSKASAGTSIDYPTSFWTNNARMDFTFTYIASA